MLYPEEIKDNNIEYVCNKYYAKNELILEQVDFIDNLDIAKEIFPNMNFDANIEMAKLIINKEQYGWGCFEYDRSYCVLHPYFFKEHRTKTKMLQLREGFLDVVIPWIKKRSVSKIMVHCDYEDDKAMRLFKFFGFDPLPIWIATMEV